MFRRRRLFSIRRPNAATFCKARMKRRIRRSPDRVQVQLTRFGNAWGIPLRDYQGRDAEGRQHVLEIAYLLEGLPHDRSLHFAVEFNFAGLPAGADDRYFHDHGNRLGQLGTQLNLTEVRNLNLSTSGWASTPAWNSIGRRTSGRVRLKPSANRKGVSNWSIRPCACSRIGT